jgi:hypothetical protein
MFLHFCEGVLLSGSAGIPAVLAITVVITGATKGNYQRQYSTI